MADQLRFQRAPGRVWRRARGSVLVMGPDRAAHQLDGAAALAWLALQEPGTAADVAQRAREHGAPGPADASDPGALAAWVDEALASLVREGIVVEDAGSVGLDDRVSG